MRQYYLIIFIGCTSLLCFGLYLEHIKGLEPCPLCIFQRIAFITIAFIAFVAAIHNPKRFFVRAYNIILIIVSIGGAGIAGRQIWLQHLPTSIFPPIKCPNVEQALNICWKPSRWLRPCK
jgi:disulfide bond formation protein DsbB